MKKLFSVLALILFVGAFFSSSGAEAQDIEKDGIHQSVDVQAMALESDVVVIDYHTKGAINVSILNRISTINNSYNEYVEPCDIDLHAYSKRVKHRNKVLTINVGTFSHSRKSRGGADG